MEETETALLVKAEPEKKKTRIKQIFNVFIFVIMLIFALQNLDNIRVSLLFLSFEMPLFVLIIAVFAIGFFTNKLFGKS